jgi:hypothetical protein
MGAPDKFMLHHSIDDELVIIRTARAENGLRALQLIPGQAQRPGRPEFESARL